jgi:hypothetical protein
MSIRWEKEGEESKMAAMEAWTTSCCTDCSNACARGWLQIWTLMTQLRFERRRVECKSVSQGSAPMEFPDFTRGLGSRGPSRPSVRLPSVLYRRDADCHISRRFVLFILATQRSLVT